ncbi:MAG TPA: aminoacyl-tRNA hydrolase, partial [Pirellulales bacterium]|nr:aminoacyl-tRNA hydrolase [Pirellulales bacterium]
GASAAKENFQGEVADAKIQGERVLLLWPQTFMNASGASVVAARDFYKLSSAELLVVCDDFNLPLGKLRIRTQGSSGGQKGLEDIIRRLGGDEVPRLRIGIGQPPDGWDPADYVLSKFNNNELPEIDAAIWRAADAVAIWVCDGAEACMNQYN